MKPVLLLTLFAWIGAVDALAAPRDFIQLQLKEREERVEVLKDEITRLNKAIEHNLDRLEKRFLHVKDSRDSMVTVQQTKERLINSLLDLAKYYQEQRDLFLTESHRSMPRAEKETLERIAKAYDEHIDDRIAQITRLSQSLAAPNPESNQGRDKQIARRTREQRAATFETLQGVIDRMKKENDELQLRMKSMSATDAAIVQEVIDHNVKLIEKRTKQLESMEDAPQIAAKPVSKSEALELRKLLEAAAQDIKEDSYRLSNLAIEFTKESEAVRQLKAQLSAHPADGHSH